MEYVSNQGGGITIIGEEFVAESAGDAEQYAMNDPYFLSVVSSGYERPATAAEISSDEVSF